MALAPAQVAALGLAVLGTGIGAAAFVGDGIGPVRLGIGITLVVAALITAGLQLLNRNVASYKADGEEA